MDRICRNCGVALAPDQTVCTNCGALNPLTQPSNPSTTYIPQPSVIPSGPSQRKCKVCGAPLAPDQRVCNHCGVLNHLPTATQPVTPPAPKPVTPPAPKPVTPPAPKPVTPPAPKPSGTSQQRRCKNCYNPLTLEQTECPNCGTLNYLSAGTKNERGITVSYAASPSDYPMRWFKFIIYFQLFANCVINFANGIGALRGVHYNGEAKLVYQIFPTLKDADTFYGVALILLALFALIVRFRLSGFHQNGPTLYYGHLIAQMAVGVIYVSMATNAMSSSSIVDTSTLWSDIAPDLVSSGILLICNFIYFRKRRHLFIY